MAGIKSVRSSSHKSLEVDQYHDVGVRAVLSKMIKADVITMNSTLHLVRGDLLIVRLKPGANINKQDIGGSTPLLDAVGTSSKFFVN